MDHEQIDQFDLIDRYLMGKLPAEESASFEEHFVDCPQCIAQLQTTKAFLQDLRFIAAAQASQIGQHQPRRAFWHVLQTLFRKPLVLVVGCLLIAAFTAAVFVIDYTRRLRMEVSQAKSVSEQWERRYEDERQSAFSADRKHQEAESQLTEQQRVLAAKLKDEQAQREKMAAEFGRRMRPEGNLPIFILNSVRSRELKTSKAANQFTLPHSSTMFAFSISLEGERLYDNCRITIFDDHRQVIWKRGGLTPDQYNSLSVVFKRGFFRPGHYSLIVEGVKKAGGREIVGNYPFLIIKTP
jgi:hypothetical protein